VSIDTIFLPDWDEFYKHIPEDPPFPIAIKLANMFYWDMEYDVILLTSRPESARPTTEAWLYDNEVPFGLLLMRPDSDDDGPVWN